MRDQDKLKEQLAGLLISRQIIGNLRESVFPYFMEQLKLAKLSFIMWGELSPTQESAQPISNDSKVIFYLNFKFVFVHAYVANVENVEQSLD